MILRHLKAAIGGQAGAQDGGESGTTEDSGGTGTGHSEEGHAETAEPEEPAEERPVEIGTVFEILKNKRRRYVLRYLVIADGQATLDEVAEQVAAWECGKPLDAITSQERKRAYVSLYQVHLPKMDDVSAISYDKPRGEMERGAHFDLFRQYLPPEEDPGKEEGGRQGWTAYIRNLV